MKNTTKLKILLQIYTISIDMDEDENFHFVLSEKTTNKTDVFIDKSYTVVIAKAFGFMKKKLKRRI